MANNVFILAAFFLYLIMMIVIGARCSANTKNTEDFYLGGRQLNGWVAAMSAQAADMSGWLLMGLPGAIYLYGLGEAWIGIGLFIGTTLNWLIVSKRIRRYTIKANNAITLPMFFENRYRDKSRFLLGISSGFIALFFLVYTASAFASGGKLISAVFGLDYHAAATIGALVILVYTFLGGFMAVCETDFIQGLLMLVGLLYVLRSQFSQLFELFRLDLLLVAMGIVVVSGVVICVVSTYFVVGHLIRLDKSELYY